MDNEQVMRLEKNIAYSFKNRLYLETAMTHSSYSHELMVVKDKKRNNERLEFLGDAVLELISSEFLFKKYSDLPEGNLSKLRASLVSEGPLAICARKIELDRFIMLGRGERQNHGNERDSILSDAFEALIGAIYLDGGIEEARRFVIEHVMTDIDERKLFHDAKTELQMIVQNKYQSVPVYEVIEEHGPAHCKEYTVTCTVEGKTLCTGTGSSKKAAQQDAAAKAIELLRVEE
ncbi:MAG: ribonuclease III [Lachnospiraceae bacterium]|nr:ribonuclease III [Lachnospiraceae bacterium]